MLRRENPNLRKELKIIAIAVGVATMAALFLSYLFTAYDYESRRVQTLANNAATDLSSLVYRAPETWRFQEDRLTELAFRAVHGGEVHQHDHQYRVVIEDSKGNLVLKLGGAPQFGEFAGTALIRDGNNIVGQLTFAEGAHDIWIRAVIPGIVGLALGAIIFLVLQTMPMRALLRRENQLRENELQLRQAQKMEAIGQLTGGIAHDFNNLLGIVVGNLEFLQDSLDVKDERRKHADDAISAALRGADLTHRLLAFARKQTLRPELVNLNDPILRMTELFQRTLGETIKVEPKLSDDLWRTQIDPAQFEEALLNLATNARHAMSDGGQLVIETSNIVLDQDYADQNEDVVPGSYVMVAVSDAGVGMAEDVLAQAFEPFFTTRDVGEGSGLGLSMVHGFVRQSGGHVSINSEVGVGTTIKLYFRAEDEKESVIATIPDSKIPSANANETILVVEDDPDLRRLTVSIVSRLGYEVLEAADGPSALALLDQGGTVDLLFTDVVLPEKMNGAELAAEALKRRPDLRVLYTSGYNESAIVHNGTLDADVNFIAKPYRKQELAQRLRGALEA